MRVLQISKFYPPVMGGIESVAWELTEGLNRAGVPTNVLCAAQSTRTVIEERAPGYSVTRAGQWGMWMSTSMSPSMPLNLRSLARDHDIIHVHMPDPMAAAAVWMVRPRGRVVVHWHSDVIRQRRALKAYEPLQNWLLARADAIVATSEPYALASVALRRWQNKVAVIPIGISDNRPTACSERAAAIRQRFGRRHLVFALGRMTYYKGFDVLIEAAAALPEECVVAIGGQGELLDHYRTQVNRRGLAGKVHLLGHIDDDELASHFEACDVFCMPSTLRAEAYGVAMVEAMVMGRPIVASDILGSGVPWVNLHGVTGLNVPAGDAHALACALGELLQSSARCQQFGHAARLRYEQEFGAERMTQRTLDLYRQLPAARLT